MNKQINKTTVTSLVPLLLFVIFTACILSVLLTGADVYQKFSKRDQVSFQHRTTVQYLTTRIRQSDTSEMVCVGSFADGPVLLDQSDTVYSGDTLFLREELGGRIFYTRIYCHDGYLRELFAEAGLNFSPSSGEKILEINDLLFTLQDDLLYIDIKYADHTKETLVIYLRRGEEVFHEK